MSTENLGNNLNRVVNNAKHALFNQGELAQLSYGAFDTAVLEMQASKDEEITVSFPVGWQPNKQAILSEKKYKKEELLKRYQFLAFHQLPVNGLVQLVTIVESVLSDIIRAVILKYPKKLGSKRTVKLQMVLEASTIEEVHLQATDSLLNELAYKSPAELAEAVKPLLSLNLLECPSFHKYMEIKASRDIFIHNRGVVNVIYLRKAGSHARAAENTQLPADISYFLESYESCLQMVEWLELQLHEHWHSSNLEEYNKEQLVNNLPDNE